VKAAASANWLGSGLIPTTPSETRVLKAEQARAAELACDRVDLQVIERLEPLAHELRAWNRPQAAASIAHAHKKGGFG
jgi:hypothetical protein